MAVSSRPPAEEAAKVVVDLVRRKAELNEQLEKLVRGREQWEASRLGRLAARGEAPGAESLSAKLRFSVDAARIALSKSGTRGPQAASDLQGGTPSRQGSAGRPSLVSGHPSDAAARSRGESLRPAVEAGRRLAVAAIMDPFTRGAFDPEATITDLHPDTWEEELCAASPDLLFIESAWRGHNDSWHDTVQKKPQELVDIVSWCRAAGVPTVFWMKEDPVYFDRYIEVAGLFDYVFTTDLEKVVDYKMILGHERVYVLPFAAQPMQCNPMLDAPRKPAAVFAGSYYEGFAQRNADLFAMIDGVQCVLPVEIYDRNAGSGKSFFEWPAPYKSLVVGSLPPEQIDVAYKGYRVALNVNTVTTSRTMLARRAFDLLACGTPTISNYSQSIRVLFGDLIDASNSADQAEVAVRRVLDDQDFADKRSAMGIRHILAEHTYWERFRHVVEIASGATAPVVRYRIGVVGRAESPRDVERIREIARSTLAEATPIIIGGGAETQAACAGLGIQHVSEGEAESVSLAAAFPRVDAVAMVHPAHWYGPHYIDGHVAAHQYSSVAASAKVGGFEIVDGALRRDLSPLEYSYVSAEGVTWDRALVRMPFCDAMSLADVADGGSLPEHLDVAAIDRFDFCAGGAGSDELCASLSAALPLRVGASIRAINAATPVDVTSGLVPEHALPTDDSVASPDGGRVVRRDSAGVTVVWSYPDGKPRYIPFAEEVALDEMRGRRAIYGRFEIEGDGRIGVNTSWRTADGQGIPGTTRFVAGEHEISVPADAVAMSQSLTVVGTGVARVTGIGYSAESRDAVSAIAHELANRTLVLTDNYPAYDDLYSNGFVHTRVRGYRDAGVRCDVFAFRGIQGTVHREFQGIDVTVGAEDALRRALDAGRYTSILVHFVNPRMWSVLRDYVGSTRIVIWCHGAEIEPYWRRDFEYTDESARRAAIQASDTLMRMWRSIALALRDGVTMVFVSNAFRDEVLEDQTSVGNALDPESVRVLHNPVDTELFQYNEKDPEYRKRVLLIRPFVSRKYANDLAVAAIEMLATEPWFGQMSFTIVGDGPLFETTVEPIARFPNVTISRGFRTHAEIAELHRNHGVFLVPTRHDTQGVSRDEAMSSGLVPVTSNIPSIGEFLSVDEGYIADYDDAVGLADALRDLYHNPETFARKSRAAAARVRQTLSNAIIISQEIAVFDPPTTATENLG